MIRKFNYTGRKKIRRSDVRIDLLRDEAGKRFFNAALRLADMALPADARIYLEAYHRTGYQRYDLGTVENRRTPPDRKLSDFSESALPLFRIKVVDNSAAHGRILAAVDKVRAESIEEAPADSQSLLFVEYDDLGHKIWNLDLDGDWPLLKLNRRVEEISLVASSDNRFLSLVYPEVLRQILKRILIEDEHTDPDCDDDWPSLWLKLACSLPGVPLPPQVSKPGQIVWIEKAVESFCDNFHMLEKFMLSMRDTR
jgi:hypothetical protein